MVKETLQGDGKVYCNVVEDSRRRNFHSDPDINSRPIQVNVERVSAVLCFCATYLNFR